MSTFENVSVQKEANVYFGGNVTSRTLTLPDGSVLTLGIMLPGEYEFGTGKPELMEIYEGELDILLPGESAWQTIHGGQSFNVGGDTKFQVRVKSITDYCCTYLDA
ncbi:pyrimidine/purine nucleoside phosphorylase [Thiomicrolovo sp. ZZH C-3]